MPTYSRPWPTFTAVILGVLTPTPLLAAAAAFDAPWWSTAPFILLLLAIAVLPIAAEKFWHSNWKKAAVTLVLAAPAAAYLFLSNDANDGRSVRALGHAMEEFASFIALLGAFYVIAGGVLLTGDIRGTPLVNTTFLIIGAVSANLIGTTGASMILIRPVLRINSERRNVWHIPIFFILLVSNLGGLLTPLGDPPLFLGFLRGVGFFWTMQLWLHWLAVLTPVLVLFFIWDVIAYRRETATALAQDRSMIEPLTVRGKVNFVLLAGVVLAALFQSPQIGGGISAWLSHFFLCPDLTLTKPWSEVVMLGLAVASLRLTPRGLRRENRFTWGPIVEVAILFAGIFVTMVPALQFLATHRDVFALTEPWQYFWCTGVLSSFLDNAPTYVTFATLAAGGGDFTALSHEQPHLLAAISCGAVFMGANTYIGNGPNFMVKAIVEETGLKMASFFGYMLYAAIILVPVYIVITWLFFVG